jgi:hypothetical protein
VDIFNYSGVQNNGEYEIYHYIWVEELKLPQLDGQRDVIGPKIPANLDNDMVSWPTTDTRRTKIMCLSIIIGGMWH